MIHLALQDNASNQVHAASLLVFPNGALDFPTVLETLKSRLGAFQTLSLKMPDEQVSPSGFPLSQGKTSTAIALSKYYGAVCLSIDAVVTEAISERSSLAGLRAWELCIRAAIEESHKETEDAGKEKRWSLSGSLESHRDHPLLLAAEKPLGLLRNMGAACRDAKPFHTTSLVIKKKKAALF